MVRSILYCYIEELGKKLSTTRFLPSLANRETVCVKDEEGYEGSPDFPDGRKLEWPKDDTKVGWQLRRIISRLSSSHQRQSVCQQSKSEDILGIAISTTFDHSRKLASGRIRHRFCARGFNISIDA